MRNLKKEGICKFRGHFLVYIFCEKKTNLNWKSRSKPLSIHLTLSVIRRIFRCFIKQEYTYHLMTHIIKHKELEGGQISVVLAIILQIWATCHCVYSWLVLFTHWRIDWLLSKVSYVGGCSHSSSVTISLLVFEMLVLAEFTKQRKEHV